jgi:hypothetical protein
VPDPGFSGFLDWTGLPVGCDPPPALCGFAGIVDFTGLPCGLVVADSSPGDSSGGVGGSTGSGMRRKPARRRVTLNHDDEAAALAAIRLLWGWGR